MNNVDLLLTKGNNKRKKKRYLYSFLIAMMIVINCTGCSGSNSDLDGNVSESFFLKDSNSKYALFNKNGKQLTKFIYTDTYSFVNGTSIVKTEGEVGIINTNGKMTVPFGKYKLIYREGNLYEATEDKDDLYRKYLIDGTGKVRYSLDNYKVLSFSSEEFIGLEDKKGDNYIFLNADGKELIKIPQVSSTDDLVVNENDEYISINYNNKNWLLNLKTGKQVISYDTSISYCINNVSDDETIFTLNSCGKNDAITKTKYIFVKNGKVYDKYDECKKIWQDGNSLICQKNDYKDYILDDNLNFVTEITKASYIDNKNYAVTVGEFNQESVQIYQNGKLVKELPCMKVARNTYNDDNVYTLSSVYSKQCGHVDTNYSIYNTAGEKINDKLYKKVEVFDSNGLNEVTEDKVNYYLINKKGEQVGKTYNSVILDENYYVIKNDTLKGIMNKEGKEIIPCTYSDIKINNHNNKLYALLKSTDSKYTVYDLNKNKEVITSDSALDINNPDYIIGISNKKKQYYTYSGKMFYEK